MISKISEYIYPLGGGSVGSIIGSITFIKIWEVCVFAIIGAVIGWTVKLFLDYCRKKVKKYMSHENNN